MSFGRLFEIMGILYVQGAIIRVVCTRDSHGGNMYKGREFHRICSRVECHKYVQGLNVKYVQGSSVNQKKAVPGGKGRV